MAKTKVTVDTRLKPIDFDFGSLQIAAPDTKFSPKPRQQSEPVVERQETGVAPVEGAAGTATGEPAAKPKADTRGRAATEGVRLDASSLDTVQTVEREKTDDAPAAPRVAATTGDTSARANRWSFGASGSSDSASGGTSGTVSGGLVDDLGYLESMSSATRSDTAVESGAVDGVSSTDGIEVNPPSEGTATTPLANEASKADETSDISAAEAREEARKKSAPEPRFFSAPIWDGALSRALRSAQKLQSSLASALAGRKPGMATSAEMTSSNKILMDEVSISAQKLLQLYRGVADKDQVVFLRSKLSGLVDESRMLTDDSYAVQEIIKYFGENRVLGLCMKMPITMAADAHVRIIRAHDGDGVLVNPTVHTMWNADHDGDKMVVSFDPEAIRGTKSAMNWLIANDREAKIDKTTFAMAKWDYDDKTVESVLEKMFGQDGDYPIRIESSGQTGLTKAEAAGLAKAIRESDISSMLMWVRAIGMRIGLGARDQDFKTARILDAIWQRNTIIRETQIAITQAAAYAGPHITGITMDGGEAGVLPGTEHNLSAGEMPSSEYAYARATNLIVGYIRNNNPLFRLFSGITKMSKPDSAFDSPRADNDIVTADLLVAQRVSARSRIGDSVESIAKQTRDLILIEMKNKLDRVAPDVSSPEAFRNSLRTFINAHDRAADVVQQSMATMGLDSSIVGYSPHVMVHIGPDMNRLRSSFNKVFGGYTMGRLFGRYCPVGWENVILSEYILYNRETPEFLGTSRMTFDEMTPAKFIGRLADLRTSFARTFDEKLSGQTDNPYENKKSSGVLGDMFAADKNGKPIRRTKIFDLLSKREAAIGKYAAIREELDSAARLGGGTKALSEKADQALSYIYTIEEEIATQAEALFNLDPDVFYHLGLTSPLAFYASTLGQKFVNAQTQNELKAALFEAVATYRFAQVRLIESRLLAAREENDYDGIVEAEFDLDIELNELASSSDVWAAIVYDYRNTESDPLLGPGQPRLLDVVMGSYSNQASKVAGAIAEAVRKMPSGRIAFESYEVAYGLFAYPRGEYSNSRFSNHRGHTELLDHIKNAKSLIKRGADAAWTRISGQVASAERKYKKEGLLTKFLTQIANNRHLLSSMELYSYVDAAINMNKSFDVGEKNSQELASNFAYQAIGYAKNGGSYSDAAMAGDVALGELSARQFQASPWLVAMVLTDPEFSIDVYTAKGPATMSMMELFGTKTPTDAQRWKWLKANPRAAMSLRRHAVGNSINNKTGFANVIAVSSLSSTMAQVLGGELEGRQVERSFAALSDRVGFYGILALSTPMTGRKRAQVRQDALSRVHRIPQVIAGFEGSGREFVDELARLHGLPVEEIAEAFKQGMELEDNPKTPISSAPLSDIRFTKNFQIGQVLDKLAGDLENYRDILSESLEGEPEEVSAEDAMDLFNLGDEENLMAYFDTVQMMSGAKTRASTSINGAMSKLLSGAMILSHARSKTNCSAPLPAGVPYDEFATGWKKYEGRSVQTGDGKPMPINVTTIHKILGRPAVVDGEKVILVEDPAACLDPLCPCPRHATNDPSTNFRRNQAAAIGRFLTVVRSLSTEGLNLKIKKIGFDDSDSVTKIDFLGDLKRGLAREARTAYLVAAASPETKDQALSIARRVLAEGMKDTLSQYGYKGELSLDDYINVAHLLIHPFVNEAGVDDVNIVSIGRLSSAINDAISREPEDIDWDRLVEVAEGVLTSGVLTRRVSAQSILSGVMVAAETGKNSPGLADNSMASHDRIFSLMKEIRYSVKNNEIPSVSNRELNTFESELLKTYSDASHVWGDIIGSDSRDRPDRERKTLRLVGVFRSNFMSKQTFGPRNAVIIGAESPKFAEAVSAAYDRGLTILLEGNPTQEQWNQVREATDNGLDADQGIRLPDRDFVRRTMIQTFDIRLNGKNTASRMGAFNAGVFTALASQVSFFMESVANEFHLSDSDFAACVSWVRNNKTRLMDTYEVSAPVAFANFISEVEAFIGGRSIDVSPVDKAEIEKYILSTDFDQNEIDLGKPYRPGSPDDKRLIEGIARFRTRAGELNEHGFLPSGMPDEIVGWLKAEAIVDGELVVRYHPIRLYEVGNDAGAPSHFTIDSMMFNKATQKLEVKWYQEETLEGRLFKIFEDMYAADKFMARAVNIPDIILASGLKLAGAVDQNSTLSRRMFVRMTQLMTTMTYMARMEPFGYNLATTEGAFTNPELKHVADGLKDGTLDIDEWARLLNDENGEPTPIEFFRGDPDMNSFASMMAREAIRYGINPNVVFASHFESDGEMRPNNLWYNFSLLFQSEPVFLDQYMKLMHKMVPGLCPDGLDDDSDTTLFNKDLKVQVPVTVVGDDGNERVTYQWVNVYGGFHFLDEHFSGKSNTGSASRTIGIPALNTLLEGRTLSPYEIKLYREWVNMIPFDPDATGPKVSIARRTIEGSGDDE